jgi:hypothetical protein
MTLGNMRANGVRTLDVCCWVCHHRTIASADPWPDDVPAVRPRSRELSGEQRRALEILAEGRRSPCSPRAISAPQQLAPSRSASATTS